MVSAVPLKILLVEDVRTDAELEVRELKRAGIPLQWRVVDTEQSFRSVVREFNPDVILSDFSMPEFDGMSALACAREVCPGIPFVFVSGTLGEEYAIRALQNGAVDYVLKTNLIRLPSAVTRAVEEARQRASRNAIEEELRAARERIDSIFAALSDVVWSVSADGSRIYYVSPAVLQVYGHPSEALVADRELLRNMIHRDDRRAVDAAWGAIVDGGEFEVEYRITRPDGTIRWVHDRARRILRGDGSLERIDGVARDITEQVEQRARITRLSRIRDVLGAMNGAIVRIRDAEGLFTEACRIVVEVGGLRSGWIGMLDKASRDLRPMAVRGDEAFYAQLPISAREDEESGQGIGGRSLRAGKVEICNDVSGGMPVRQGPALLAAGVLSGASFPILVEGEPVGVFILHAGERGYFDREEVHLLTEVTANIGFALELMAKQERLNYLAYYDPLTGLPNRIFFQSRLMDTLDAARSRGSLVALMVFNIERFKMINDTLGQRGGDALLQQLASRLRSIVKESGRIARLAGDQFAVLFPVLDDAGTIGRIFSEQIGPLIDEPFVVDEREVRIAAKAAIAVFPDDGADADTLFRNAEAALKKARTTGERLLFYAPDINARVAERMDLEHRLRRAVERREFELHYQPKVDFISRKIVGLEGLMRWRDPASGLVSPARFIPILEETGLILEAGRWAMEEAVRVYRIWRENGLNPPRVAVNVSAIQLRNQDFVQGIEKLLSSLPDAERGLDLEITESLLMESIEESIDKLRAIQNLGVEIAIDDFGTGYSSLAYIGRLPVHHLKIDRSFVSRMTDHPDSTTIVSTIISLGQALRLKVVAEGVETEEQAQLLKLLRCDQMQGYLFARPMPQAECEALLVSAV